MPPSEKQEKLVEYSVTLSITVPVMAYDKYSAQEMAVDRFMSGAYDEIDPVTRAERVWSDGD